MDILHRYMPGILHAAEVVAAQGGINTPQDNKVGSFLLRIEEDSEEDSTGHGRRLRKLVREDLDRLTVFGEQADGRAFVDYEAACKLIECSKDTVKRAVRAGKIRRWGQKKSRPVRLEVQSVLAFAFKSRPLPARSHEREAEILWRLLFVQDFAGNPMEDAADIWCPKMPKGFRELMTKMTPAEIRVLQGGLCANRARGAHIARSEIRKRYLQWELDVIAAGLVPDFKEIWTLAYIPPRVCPHCRRQVGRSLERSQMECLGCDHLWRLDEGQSEDWYRGKFEELNTLLPARKQLSIQEWEQYKHSADALAVLPLIRSKDLLMKASTARSSLGNDIVNSAFTAINRTYDALRVSGSAAVRFALPRAVREIVNVQIASGLKEPLPQKSSQSGRLQTGEQAARAIGRAASTGSEGSTDARRERLMDLAEQVAQSGTFNGIEEGTLKITPQYLRDYVRLRANNEDRDAVRLLEPIEKACAVAHR